VCQDVDGEICQTNIGASAKTRTECRGMEVNSVTSNKLHLSTARYAGPSHQW